MSCDSCDNGTFEGLGSGHRGCAGCGEATGVRQVLRAAGPNTIVANATGCLEVMTTGYPESAWNIPWIHAAFENAASVASGIESALRMLKRKEGVNVFAFAGDGGTFDIGFQALSGMLERGQNVKYVCFDNEAYMNTGIQRCSSTPYGASTTTSPSGSCSIGESRPKKPIASICAAHGIPYTATATIAFHKDLERKVKKACEIDGPAFLHVLVPCPTGWRYPTEKTVELSKLAVRTGSFVLWELEGGDFRNINVTRKLSKKLPIEDYLMEQGRFRHIVKKKRSEDGKIVPNVLDEKTLGIIQQEIDEKLERYGVMRE